MKFFEFIGGLIRGVFYVVFTLVLVSVLFLIFSHEKNSKGNIAVVEITGPIDDTKDLIKDMKEYREDHDIKAIILRVDSPGGAVGASQEVYDEVIKTKAVKPVIASFGNMAASGGYYVSASASKIVANPGTLTGSIGVITEFFQVDDILKKFNLKWEVIKSAPHKDIGSPLRPMTQEERELLQAMVSDVYDQFVTAVSDGRKIPKEKVKVFADGRVFSGRKAKELGLVDELGGLEKAIDVAAREAHLKEKPELVYPDDGKIKFLDQLTQGKLAFPNLFKMEYRLHM